MAFAVTSSLVFFSKFLFVSVVFTSIDFEKDFFRRSDLLMFY